MNERLTKWKEYKTNKRLYRSNKEVSLSDLVWKLGLLEDVEDELGIDLITLFKALKKETLFIKTDFDIKETIKNGEGWGMKHLSFEDGEFVIFAQILYPNDITHKEWLTPLRLKLKDYGKTWSLDKNDLTSE